MVVGMLDQNGTRDGSLGWRVNLNVLNGPFKHHVYEITWPGTIPGASDTLRTCWGEETHRLQVTVKHTMCNRVAF